MDVSRNQLISGLKVSDITAHFWKGDSVVLFLGVNYVQITWLNHKESGGGSLCVAE